MFNLFRMRERNPYRHCWYDHMHERNHVILPRVKTSYRTSDSLPSFAPWYCTPIHNSGITATRIACAGEISPSLSRWPLSITCLIESVGARIPCTLRRSSDSHCMTLVNRRAATMRRLGSRAAMRKYPGARRARELWRCGLRGKEKVCGR